jgi:hypothetical protein
MCPAVVSVGSGAKSNSVTRESRSRNKDGTR